jgi:hypothetical protein
MFIIDPADRPKNDPAVKEVKPKQSHEAEIEHRYVVEIPPQLENDEWEEKYGSSSIQAIDLKMIRQLSQIVGLGELNGQNSVSAARIRLDSANLSDLSKGHFAPAFLSSNPSCQPRSRSLALQLQERVKTGELAEGPSQPRMPIVPCGVLTL